MPNGPHARARETMIEIENDAGQVIEFVLIGTVRGNTTPVDALSGPLRVRDQG